MAGRFAMPLLRWSVIFTLFCHLYGHHSGQTGRNLFVSLSGKDSKMCGSPDMPCRTIGRAVQQGAWGDTIYLDGTGTEQQPHNCPITTYDIPGIHVTKSLSIIGFSSMAHVSCTSGAFLAQPTRRENMPVKLSNIEFRGTAVIFRNCSAHIEGCTFRDTLGSSAIGFKAGGIPGNVFLVITNASFANNSLCIAADFSNSVSELNVLIDVQNTRFQGNGLVTSPSGTGGILLSNSSKAEGVMHVRVRCSNVSYVENQGSFMTVDLVTAITDESYTNMAILRNEIQRVYRKNLLRGVLKSLYCARTKKSKFAFTSVRCENNKNARCVGISSDELSLKIRGSLFTGQDLNSGSGGALFIARPEGSVNISLENTQFVKNSAQVGGCVCVDDGNGTVNLDIFNVTFKRCLAYKQGSALIVGGYQGRKPDPKKGIRKLCANIRNVLVLKCNLSLPWGKSKFGAICFYIKEVGQIKFDHVVWVGNNATGCPALLVGVTQGSAQITINDSLLVENKGNFGTLCTASVRPAAGTVTVLNTRIINAQHIGMVLDPLFKINLRNVTVNSSNYAALVMRHWVWETKVNKSYDVTINITDCLFKYNRINIQCTLNSPEKVAFTVRDSIFSGPLPKPTNRKSEKQGIYSFFFIIPPSKRQNPSEVHISLENVTIDSITSFLLSAKLEAKLRMRIKSSIFKNCTILCLHKRGCDSRGLQYGGAVTILLGPDQSETSGCTSNSAYINTHPTWTYTNHIVFEDTVFIGNEGLAAGAVYLENGHASFTRCLFKNNFALWRRGHVTVAPGSGRVDLISSTFYQTTAISRRERKVTGPQFFKFLYSQSFGQINVTNTSLINGIFLTNPQHVFDIARGGYVYIDQDSHIKCSVGSKLTLENLTHLAPMKFTYSAKGACKMNLTILRYSCGMCPPGTYSLQRGSSSGLFVQREFQCLFCPYGADCTRNIVAKPGFWGYRVSTHRPSLNFTSCPEEYCSPPRDSPPSVYNGCYGNRAGVLCGTCHHGYTESLFSTECRSVEECSQIWFWIGSAFLLLCLALFLVKKPPVFVFLHRQIFWFRQQSSEHQVFEADLGPSQHSDSGYLKITFYFYQVADLLLVGSFMEVARQVPIIVPVVGLFKLQIQSFDAGIGCPFAGLTAVTKELFMSLGPFAVLAYVFAIYAVHRLINFTRGQDRPHLIQYLAVALETLLLGYERLAETALKLLRCIPLGSDWRLFYDGNIVCWQWWQTVILLYISVFLVPFIGVLYWGSLLLHWKRISFREFLGACVLPVPFLIRWAVFYLTGRLKDRVSEECIGEEVLEVLHGPFRSPSNQDAGSLYWESVLIGRRFILLSLSASIVNPMMRLACMTGACVLMTFHHVFKSPYRELNANRVETVSLQLLVLLGVLNLARVSSQFAGSEECFASFRWLEAACLALAPCLLALITVFAILPQFARLLIFLASKIMYFVSSVRSILQNRHHQSELRAPLLAPTDDNTD